MNSQSKLQGELFDLMRRLVRRIKKELRTAKHCAVYNDEIARIWPSNGKRREKEIARFASANGWRLRFYREGFCAIFDNAPPTRSEKIS